MIFLHFMLSFIRPVCLVFFKPVLVPVTNHMMLVSVTCERSCEADRTERHYYIYVARKERKKRDELEEYGRASQTVL